MSKEKVAKPSYRYALELLRTDGAMLGQIGIEPDWRPAREWADFLAIRKGQSPSGEACVEPLWHLKTGRPYLSGFSLSLPTGEGKVSSLLPLTYVAALAETASQGLVEQGDLRPGEIFFYHVLAYLSESSREEKPGSAFKVEELAPSLPLN